MVTTNDYNEVFMALVNDSAAAARGIPDAAKKAEILARLAQAVAATGLVNGIAETAEVTASQEPKHMGSEDKAAAARAKAEAEPSVEKKPDAKEALKQKPDKTVNDTVKNSVKAEKKEEVELPKLPKKMDKKWTTEWTDEAFDAFSDELSLLDEKISVYGEELNEAIKEFSEGKYSTPEDLNPLNIHAFMVYLEALEKSMEEDVG